MPEYIQAGHFKSKCLKIMDEVSRSKHPIIITKRNRPVVKIIPVEVRPHSLFGCMKGSIHILADLIAPIGEVWNVDCD